MLEVKALQTAPVLVLAIQGSVDSLTAESLTQTLESYFSAGHSRVVADLSGLSYTSSAGLRSILIAVKRARKLGGDFHLAAVQASVMEVLTMSGFTNILKVFPTVGAAASSLGS
jgi:anti-sigma B factor antagonist